MKTNEETLSDKSIELFDNEGVLYWDLVIPSKDVKDFIKKLKEHLRISKFFSADGYYKTNDIINFIDKLAGKELI